MVDSPKPTSPADSVRQSADPEPFHAIRGALRKYWWVTFLVIVSEIGTRDRTGLQSYNWTLTVQLCNQTDGTLTAKINAEAGVDDVAGILSVSLQSRSDGRFMTVGRTYSVAEKMLRLSPMRSAIFTPPLRPMIAATLSRSVRPPDFASELSPRAEAEYQKALAVYASGAATKTLSQVPPWQEWFRLFAALAVVWILGIKLAGRIRLAIYRSRGRERLALDQCPHCGYTLALPADVRCPECGTDHAQWAARMRVRSEDAVANSDDPIPPPPVLPPPTSPAA